MSTIRGSGPMQGPCSPLVIPQRKAPRPVTWGFVVAGVGFEPATFGL